MSKGQVFVGMCSVVLIMVFLVLCFLMGSVNPPKLHPETNPLMQYFRKRSEFDDFPIEKKNKKLESSVPFYRYETINSTKIKSPFIRSPPYDLKLVVPPKWPSYTTPDTTVTKKIENTTIFIKKNTDNAQDKKVNLTANMQNKEIKPSSKGRRSIDKSKKQIYDDSSGTINFKVLDEVGYPRIEIKMHGNTFNKNVNERFSIQVEKNDQDYEVAGLDYNAEIRILPNGTIKFRNNFDDKTNIKISDMANDSEAVTDKSVVAPESSKETGQYLINNRTMPFILEDSVSTFELEDTAKYIFVDTKVNLTNEPLNVNVSTEQFNIVNTIRTPVPKIVTHNYTGIHGVTEIFPLKSREIEPKDFKSDTANSVTTHAISSQLFFPVINNLKENDKITDVDSYNSSTLEPVMADILRNETFIGLTYSDSKNMTKQHNNTTGEINVKKLLNSELDTRLNKKSEVKNKSLQKSVINNINESHEEFPSNYYNDVMKSNTNSTKEIKRLVDTKKKRLK